MLNCRIIIWQIYKIILSVNLKYDKTVVYLIDICYMTKDQLKKKVGNRVVELRTKKGWNQSDLARECGKDRQAIEKLENGKVNPTVYSLYEISKALKVELYQLIKFWKVLNHFVRFKNGKVKNL